MSNIERRTPDNVVPIWKNIPPGHWPPGTPASKPTISLVDVETAATPKSKLRDTIGQYLRDFIMPDVPPPTLDLVPPPTPDYLKPQFSDSRPALYLARPNDSERGVHD